MNKKLLAASLLAGGMVFTGVGVNAAECGTQIIRATLAEFASIKPDNSVVCATQIDPDDGDLNAALQSKFDVKLNYAPDLKLSATAESTTGDEVAFFKKGSDVYIVLANITNKPTTAAIGDIVGGSPAAANNSNAISYKISGLNLTGALSGKTPVFNTDCYEIEGAPGISTVVTNVDVTALADTYDLTDTAGTYEAEVKLCTVTP